MIKAKREGSENMDWIYWMKLRPSLSSPLDFKNGGKDMKSIEHIFRINRISAREVTELKYVSRKFHLLPDDTVFPSKRNQSVVLIHSSSVFFFFHSIILLKTSF